MSNYSKHVTSGNQGNKSNEDLEKANAQGRSHRCFQRCR